MANEFNTKSKLKRLTIHQSSFKSIIQCLFIIILLAGVNGEDDDIVKEVIPSQMCKVWIEPYRFDLSGSDRLRSYSTQVSYDADGKGVSDVKIMVLGRLCSGIDEKEIRAATGLEKLDFDKNYDSATTNTVIIVFQQPDAKVYGLTRLNDKTHPTWTVEYYLDSENDLSADEEIYSMINYRTMLKESFRLSDDKKLKTIIFENRCESVDNFAPLHFGRLNWDAKELVFLYIGPKACENLTPDLIHFLSKSYTFLFILFTTSLFGLLVDRNHERIAMALCSVQAALMICAFVLLENGNSGLILPYEESAHWDFGVLCIIFSFAVFGFSFFSRYFSLAFVCVSLSYAVVWTIVYTYTLIFRTYLNPLFYLFGVVVTCLVIVCLSYRSNQIKEKYSYVVYTSVTNSFFLCVAAFIAMNSYLDVLSFNKYKEYGKVDRVAFKNLLFLILQVVLTMIIITWKLKKEMMVKLSAIKANANLFKERYRNSDLDPFADKGDNETIIAM